MAIWDLSGTLDVVIANLIRNLSVGIPAKAIPFFSCHSRIFLSGIQDKIKILPPREGGGAGEGNVSGGIHFIKKRSGISTAPQAEGHHPATIILL